MTNRQFILKIYPDAICNHNASVFIVYDNNDDLGVLGYSSVSTTLAWRSAAYHARKEMLWKLEQ